VQDREEADLSAEALRFRRHFEQLLGAGRKQQVVDGRPGACKPVELLRHGEHDMKVVSGKQFTPSCLDPSLSPAWPTLGTASAGVVKERCFVLTAGTLIFMSAEGRGTGTLDGSECLQQLIAAAGLEAF
jgi:hypothetical protein